jgi:phospholipase/carboxylesterase
MQPRRLRGPKGATVQSAHKNGQILARPEALLSPIQRPGGVEPLALGRPRDGLIYWPRERDFDRPIPLLVALHGAGGDGRSMLELLRPSADELGFGLLLPDSRGRTWDFILGGFGSDVAFLDRALVRAFAGQRTDPEKIAIAGFSDGASYALSLGLANGDLFKSVLAFSPGFLAPVVLR